MQPSRRGFRRRTGAGLLLCAAMLAPAARAAAAKFTLRYVLAQDPDAVSRETARLFAERVEKDTGGEVRVVVVPRAEFAAGRADAASKRQLLERLRAGDYEMSPVNSAELARENHELWALGQPYLFRDYAHAEAVFEGPLAARILALPESSGLSALSVAYAGGGFGMIATTGREIRSPADMKRLKLLTERSPWLRTIVWRMKVEPLSVPLEAFVAMSEKGFVDALETTVARFVENGQDRTARVVCMTGHYLQTAMLVVNARFYRSLPEKDRDAVARAARDAARDDRARTVRANADGRALLEKRGVKFVDLTAAELSVFRNALAPMYALPYMQDGSGLVSVIREAETPAPDAPAAPAPAP